MKGKELYRAVILGPTGVGKSQFCNFVRRDLTNTINKVSDELDSCTQEPFTNYFTRNGTSFEFIDTAGSGDSSNNDTANLEKLINYLKIIRQIDYIILVLRFNERLTNTTKEYIETFGKTFTPNEFFKHLCIFFTKFPLNPRKKENNLKKVYSQEMKQIFSEIFHLNGNKDDEKMPELKIYYINTEIDEKTNTFIEEYQEIIDTMLEQMKADVSKYHSIDTTNLDITGKSVKLRIENERKEIERLNKLLEEERLRKEKEEEAKNRLQEELEMERKRKEEIEKKEREYREKLRRQEEEIRRIKEREKSLYEERRKIEERQRQIESIQVEEKKFCNIF